MNKTGALGDIFHHFDITQSGISLQDFLREKLKTDLEAQAMRTMKR
jgi:hypothetical protein